MAEILAFMKCDAILRRSTGANILNILANDEMIEIVSLQKKQVPPALVDQHYAHLVDKPFYGWLMEYTTAFPVFAMILSGSDGVIEHLRELLGSTMSHKAEPGTIRSKFGIYSGINCMHASDSAESAQHELEIWNKAVGLDRGQFDINVNNYVEQYLSLSPVLTEELREVCLSFADGNRDKAETEREMLRKLQQECLDSTESDIKKLCNVIIGAV